MEDCLVMKPQTFEALNCSVTRALERVGERWTLLIIREAFFGVCWFTEFLFERESGSEIEPVRVLSRRGVRLRPLRVAAGPGPGADEKVFAFSIQRLPSPPRHRALSSRNGGRVSPRQWRVR